MRQRHSKILSFKKPQAIRLRDNPMDDFLDVVVHTFKPRVQQQIHLELFTEPARESPDDSVTIGNSTFQMTERSLVVQLDTHLSTLEWDIKGIQFGCYHYLQTHILHPILDVLFESMPSDETYWEKGKRFYRAYRRGQGAIRLLWDTDFVCNYIANRVVDFEYGMGRSRRHADQKGAGGIHPDPIEREVAALESLNAE